MRLRNAVTSIVACCASLNAVSARSVTAGRTLVVGDEKITGSDEFSNFFGVLDSLAGNSTVEYKQADDESIDLVLFESELKYDTLVLLPVKQKSLGPRLTSKKLLTYFEKGGNVLAVTTPSSVPESLREFASQLDIFISPKGYVLTDHFVGKGDKHEDVTIGADGFVGESVVDQAEGDDLVYHGNAAYLGNNAQLIPILSAPDTSYVYDTREEGEEFMRTPWVQGTQTSLAAAFQGRFSNSRFAWTGDLGLFKNSAGVRAHSLIKDLAAWTAQEKGVIRAYNPNHFIIGDDTDERSNGHKLYQMKKEMSYQLTFSKWNGEKWGPFEADDIQLEFVMLDPYYRLNMEKFGENDKETLYGVTFKSPDQYGMFTFKVEYLRPGLSFVEEREVVTVRHMANDEWPRSWEIPNSWIYLTSSIAVIGGWFLFVIFYLYSAE